MLSSEYKVLIIKIITDVITFLMFLHLASAGTLLKSH